MILRGRVQNGVVVLQDRATLPEGMEVSISYTCTPGLTSVDAGQRVELPLVRSDHPGSVVLTSERIAEILDEEDVARIRKQQIPP